MADIVDADELRSKKKRPGLFYSILTTLSKLGAALAVGSVYSYLEFSGFKPDVDAVSYTHLTQPTKA